jgi:hypothetical protein
MRAEPTYRQALSHAWDIARNHPLLWIFGFFATFLGQMGLLDIFVHTAAAADGFVVGFPFLFDIVTLFSTMIEGFKNMGPSLSNWGWFVWLAAFFIAVKLLLIFVATVSQGALIHGVNQSIRGRRTTKKKINTTKAWHAGTGHFWRLFFINLAKRVTILVMAGIVGLATVGLATSGSVGGTVFFTLSFSFALIFGMILSFLAVYAAAYVVIEEMSFGDAVFSAWRLFANHTLVSLEVGLLLLLANVVAGVLAIAGMLLFVVHMGLFFALTLIIGSQLVWFLGAFIGVLGLILLVTFLGTILTVFATSVWTYLFVRMHKKGVKSRVMHMLRLS